MALDRLAGTVADYQRAHHLDDAALAERVGCPIERLAHLKLCSHPRASHWQQDVETIASYLPCHAISLAAVLREQAQ